MVSTHSRPKAAGLKDGRPCKDKLFQHTAARRRLESAAVLPPAMNCFNTQPPEGGWVLRTKASINELEFQHTAARRRLAVTPTSAVPSEKFQHTAARRRLGFSPPDNKTYSIVSTHSRPKAAGIAQLPKAIPTHGFNTQPPEGGWASRLRLQDHGFRVSTHSRPKAAGVSDLPSVGRRYCFNTQPPEGGWSVYQSLN